MEWSRVEVSLNDDISCLSETIYQAQADCLKPSLS